MFFELIAFHTDSSHHLKIAFIIQGRDEYDIFNLEF